MPKRLTITQVAKVRVDQSQLIIESPRHEREKATPSSLEIQRFHVEQAMAEELATHSARKTQLLREMNRFRGKIAAIDVVEVNFQQVDKQHNKRMNELHDERVRIEDEEERLKKEQEAASGNIAPTRRRLRRAAMLHSI